jgi:hypothetical protein
LKREECITRSLSCLMSICWWPRVLFDVVNLLISVSYPVPLFAIQSKWNEGDQKKNRGNRSLIFGADSHSKLSVSIQFNFSLLTMMIHLIFDSLSCSLQESLKHNFSLGMKDCRWVSRRGYFKVRHKYNGQWNQRNNEEGKKKSHISFLLK